MAPRKALRCSCKSRCTRRTCALPRSEWAYDQESQNEADRELDLLEVQLKVNWLEAQDARPREGEGNDASAASSSDSDEEPTDYFPTCGKHRRRKSDDSDSDQSDQTLESDSDKSSANDYLMDPGEIDDAESDYDEDFRLEGGQWGRRYERHDGRKRDRDRLYELGKREHEAGIQRRALLDKLARIGGLAASPSPPEARFTPWEPVDWTARDVATGEQVAKRVVDFYNAQPDVARSQCNVLYVEVYSKSSSPRTSHACVLELHPFQEWKTVDWAAPDVATAVQPSVEDEGFPLQAVEHVFAFFDARPDVDRTRHDVLCLKFFPLSEPNAARSPVPRFQPWKTVDWTAPDVPTGVQAAVDGSRLPLQALERVIAFFDAHPGVDRGRCDAFCLEAYPSSSSSSRAAHACVSEFQFADSYMVEVVEEEEAGTTDDGTDARMTLFWFTFEPVDEAAILAARKAYDDFVPKYTRVGALALGSGQPELPVWRIACARGRPLSAEAARLTLAVNGPRYEAVLRSCVNFAMAPTRRRGGGSVDVDADAWPTAPYNPRCGGDNLIVRPGRAGVGGLVLWTVPAPVELPLGAALCGLLPVLGQPMRPPAEVDPKSKYQWVVDLLPFQGHRRDGDRFQLPCMEQLQAQDAMPAVESDARPWQRIFAAMAEGVDLAADIADADKPYYKREIKILSGAWFYARRGAYSPDAPQGEPPAR